MHLRMHQLPHSGWRAVRESLVAAVALFAVVGVSGCSHPNPCDENQFDERHLCKPKLDAAPTAPVDSGTSMAEAGTGGMCTTPTSGFGDPCGMDTIATDCKCGLDGCYGDPSNPPGKCTKTCNLEDPSTCPAGYECFDRATVFGVPSLTAVCTEVL